MGQQSLQLTFHRVQTTQEEMREIKATFKEALNSSKAYHDAVEDVRIAREKKKKIEDNIKDDFQSELDKLDTLKLDIENDKMILSDQALIKLVKGETVEVEDSNGVKYLPEFKVIFKKA